MRYTYNNKLLQSFIIVTLYVRKIVYSSIVPILQSRSRADSDTIDCLYTPPNLACAIVWSQAGKEIGPTCNPWST